MDTSVAYETPLSDATDNCHDEAGRVVRVAPSPTGDHDERGASSFSPATLAWIRSMKSHRLAATRRSSQCRRRSAAPNISLAIHATGPRTPAITGPLVENDFRRATTMSARSQALTAISNAAHPNVNELAEITSLSVQSVRRTLQRLITDGKVDRIGKRGDRNTRYRRR
jgi:hypothetical protein